MGKLGAEDLKKLLSCIKKDSRVVIPPLPGFDSGVHLIDDKYLVVSTDPCIGVSEKWFGWLLIHYAASDLALFGAQPEFCTINLLGSPRTKPDTFYQIMGQVCKAAEELKMAIVTGHTGTYEDLSALIGVCTAYGMVDKERLITPSGARPGDYILCIKSIGLETVVNFALTHASLAERLFGVRQAQKLTELVYMQSCVKEALLLAKIQGVHAMHDTTEGGLTAALNELASASKVGFQIEFGKIPFHRDVQTLQEWFKLLNDQLLSMSSTGTILAAVSPEAKDQVERELHKNDINTSYIGVFTKKASRTLVKDGKERSFPKRANDPYERIMTGKSC